MFLTDRQIRRLTGELEKAAQIRWLEANRVRHWITACGKPIVPCSEIVGSSASAPSAAWSPDYSKVGA